MENKLTKQKAVSYSKERLLIAFVTFNDRREMAWNYSFYLFGMAKQLLVVSKDVAVVDVVDRKVHKMLACEQALVFSTRTA